MNAVFNDFFFQICHGDDILFQFTLWRIVSLIEGPLHAVACLECPVNECARCGFCITLPAWEGLEKVVHDYLESVSLQQLIDQAKPQPSNLEDYPCGV